jgi:hypothetical protein
MWGDESAPPHIPHSTHHIPATIMPPMAEELTELQRVILEVDALGLSVRDSIKQVSPRVGYFVGQQKYLEELEKARLIVEQGEAPDRVGTEAARGEF